MLFHEIYGSYYNAVACVVRLAINGELDEKSLRAVIDEKSFSESFLEIISSLKSEKWKLLHSDFTTPIHSAPSMPLTTLQLRWLKAITLDRRMQLFDVNTDFLREVEPLFRPEDYILFDSCCDGDPFDDEEYIAAFRTVLRAIREHKKVRLEYHAANGTVKRSLTCDPFELEYSEKDDKFRVNVASCRSAPTMRLAGIKNCKIIGKASGKTPPLIRHSGEYFIAELLDERNALERFLLHFAHFKKEAEQLSENRYRVKVYYNKADETELVIRVLSFGPFVRVTEPVRFVNLIKNRLILQKSCGLK